jgi:hypothetical protein
MSRNPRPTAPVKMAFRFESGDCVVLIAWTGSANDSNAEAMDLFIRLIHHDHQLAPETAPLSVESACGAGAAAGGAIASGPS